MDYKNDSIYYFNKINILLLIKNLHINYNNTNFSNNLFILLEIYFYFINSFICNLVLIDCLYFLLIYVIIRFIRFLFLLQLILNFIIIISLLILLLLNKGNLNIWTGDFKLFEKETTLDNLFLYFYKNNIYLKDVSNLYIKKILIIYKLIICILSIYIIHYSLLSLIIIYNYKIKVKKNKLFILIFYILGFLIINIFYTSIFFIKIIIISVYLNMNVNKSFINFLLYFIANYEKHYSFNKILCFCNYYIYFVNKSDFNN